jgi:hypothetical protein
MSKWSHLPNASRIDWVLDHAEKNPEAWGYKYRWENPSWVARVRMVRRGPDATGPRSEIFNAARHIAHDKLDMAGPAKPYRTYSAVCMTLVGLITYDNIDYILDADPKALEIYVGLGVESAVLLQIMHKILHPEKELDIK